MKVLVLTDITGYQVGGVVTAVVDLLGGLASRGHRATLLSDVPFAGLSRSVEHVSIPDARAADYADRVADAIIAMSPDVVHLNQIGQRALRLLLPVLSKTRWLLTLHSISPWEKVLRAFHGRDRLHYLSRDAVYLPNTLGWRFLFMRRAVPHVVVHSVFMRKVIRAYGQADDGTSVIELGSSRAEVVPLMRHAGPPAPTIVTVAGYAHSKGHHDAMRAASLLRTRYPGIQYRMTGETRDRAYREYLESLARRLGMATAFTFAERLGEPAKMAWLQEADVYVQPSHEEGFCLAYLEAARLSRRLVGTDTGAIRQIGGDDPAMRTVPPRDPGALAAAMADLLDQPAPTREQLSQRHTRLQTRFSVERYVADHEALYQRLCRMKSRSTLSLGHS